MFSVPAPKIDPSTLELSGRNKHEDEEISDKQDIKDLMFKLGYHFDLTDVQGIQHRDDAMGGLMMIMYTCAVEGCGTKQARTFSKQSYERGVVLVRCENCDSLHLIADNLGWFEDDGVKRESINVESILKRKGESVTKFVSQEGVEIAPNEEEEAPIYNFDNEAAFMASYNYLVE